MSKEIINTLVNKYSETRKTLAAEVKANFRPLFNSAFETFPNLDNVSWVQYTPHFNDGEPCEFNVYGFDFNAESGEIDRDYGKCNAYIQYLETEEFPASWCPYYSEEICQQRFKVSRTEKLLEFVPDYLKNLSYQELKEHKEKLIILEELNSLLNSIPVEVYGDVFGDGSEVIVSRTGIEVNDYDHD